MTNMWSHFVAKVGRMVRRCDPRSNEDTANIKASDRANAAPPAASRPPTISVGLTQPACLGSDSGAPPSAGAAGAAPCAFHAIVRCWYGGQCRYSPCGAAATRRPRWPMMVLRFSERVALTAATLWERVGRAARLPRAFVDHGASRVGPLAVLGSSAPTSPHGVLRPKRILA